MAYLLDANVFIEAKNRYYGLDFCPASGPRHLVLLQTLGRALEEDGRSGVER